ncbi:MAG: hypothetical protein LBG96_11120 [Tannerella sp.]|nr:hypothetical protein [Tannerella sp.]
MRQFTNKIVYNFIFLVIRANCDLYSFHLCLDKGDGAPNRPFIFCFHLKRLRLAV